MLINTQGKAVNPETLPKGGKQREAVLATLREVHVVRSTKKLRSFSIQERARLV